ncbi:hypothetical protein Cha6605_1814 [Chamaesiphon minutus PCC 6605]|uniref:Uncharacterized protein n=2 Tax=Chamaesiphon TaxID=217161 RepID=K9UDN3_CHAP6|nr:hypothetical protein Cha6605_1814 [Chamaesiphon minutus PCC 6605]
MVKGKRGRPRQDPSKIVTPSKVEQSENPLDRRKQRSKYKKLQLYYYFTVGRNYINSNLSNDYERESMLKKVETLDKLNIPQLMGQERLLTVQDLTDWFENLYQYRFELIKFRIDITRKTRLACAAQRVVRLFGLDIVRFDRVMENGRLEYRYRGANSHSDADRRILNEWLERDRQAAQADEIDRD